MNLGRFEVQAQRGAGPDGAAYQGCEAGSNQPVEIRILTSARADDQRWRFLAKRLRTAAMLDHTAAVSLRELALEHNPPYVVLEWVAGQNLAAALHADVPFPETRVLPLGVALLSALAAAHRLGLAHGRLRPGTICLENAGTQKIDFTDIDTGTSGTTIALAEVEAACRPPEHGGDRAPQPAADIYSVGAVLSWMLTGRPAQAMPPAAAGATAALAELLGRMLARDPEDRPTAGEALAALTALRAAGAGAPVPGEPGRTIPVEHPVPGMTAWSTPPGAQTSSGAAADEARRRLGAAPQRLGRFRLLEKLGEGGLGMVYRAEDMTDGSVVAIKVLSDRWESQSQALRRLRKEARLLAEVANPYVANLIEFNEDSGVLYLVLEFVAGKDLNEVLIERRSLPEREALAIMADVARALVDAHKCGIVHRDIKPGNILLVNGNTADRAGGAGDGASPALRVKLCDFGLARHLLQSESLDVTRSGTALGTPAYASPEQCAAGPVDAATDVYAMGATLYHMLGGRPPFQADSALALAMMHTREAPMPLQKVNPAVSEATCALVAKALAKHPAQRYADAGSMLADLERLLRGEPANIVVHPRLPACDARKLYCYDWIWELDAAPDQLWPYVSNTERLNRAVGLPAVAFTTGAAEPSGAAGPAGPPSLVRRFGKFRKAGFTNVWQEHPFEWIEGRRMGVLREYSQGVFRWLATMTELHPRAGGGTTLVHQVRIEPAGLLGRFVATVEVGIKGRRIVERVYRRIDAFLTGKLGRSPGVDPFEEPAALSRRHRRRLDESVERLLAGGIEPAVAEQLSAFLTEAAPQEVARIRPLALARRLGLDPDQVVNACLLGAREGLLVLLWDILCPVCRIPSSIQDTLRELGTHGHCEACNLDFALDFASSVELIFRVHPQVRASELGTYCIGGPVHSPHVAAQVRVGPGERIELDLALSEGRYRLRGPQLPFALDVRVQPSAALTRWDVRLGPDGPAEPSPPLRAGRQLVVVTNDHGQELLVRVERLADRTDALTAARASTLARFREWFPAEVLAPGQLASVAAVTFLVTDLDRAGDLDNAGNLYQALGDARAFGVLHEHFTYLGECIRREGGALVKTVGEGVVASFPDPLAAVRVALALMSDCHLEMTGDRAPALRIGIHRGPALAASINDRLDYFGTTVSQAVRLPQFIRGGEMVLTSAVAFDPDVAELLHQRGMTLEVLAASLPGQPGSLLHRLTVPKNQSN